VFHHPLVNVAMCVGKKAYSHCEYLSVEKVPQQMSLSRTIHQLSKVRNFIVILCVILGAASSEAQVTRASQRAFDRAVVAYEQRNVTATQMELKKAIEKSPEFAEAFFLLAQTYRDQHDESTALVALCMGLRIDDSHYPRGWLELAELYWGQGEYSLGIVALQSFRESRAFSRVAKDSALSQYYHWVRKGLEFSVVAVNNPSGEINPVVLSGGVNTNVPEYYPSMSLDKQVLIMTRRVEGNPSQEDFYLSRWNTKSGEWRVAGAIPGINTPLNEGAATLSGDGLTIVFTACEGPAVGYGRREGKGSCDLFESHYIQELGEWSVGDNLGAPNSGAWESQPTISADGNFLVFARARHVRGMGSDLFGTYRDKDGVWSTPFKLEGEINTPFEEESPFLHPDGRTLYFSSNGHPGLGHLDMFVSHLQDDGSWSPPLNLGYPMNTHGNENSLMVEPDGSYAIFATDRSKETGDLDLWRVELPEPAKPTPVGVLYGVVVDDLTNEMLEASVILLDAVSGELIATVASGADKGFVLPLPSEGSYSFEVDKVGYMFQMTRFKMSGLESQVVEVRLKKIASGASLSLNTIRFESGSAELSAGYQADLVRLVNWLEVNLEAEIEIIGHTDNVGNDSNNLRLSKSRAMSVLSFLEANHIGLLRLSHGGKGSSDPLSPNSTEEGRASNRRVEIIVK
tara:strand:- start:223 stop:2274 length:2052 start_codon:yes stop_codon:yes gene_type:complete